MLTREARAELDKARVYEHEALHYVRTADENPSWNVELRLDPGRVYVHGTVQTIDELEYVLARLVAAARKGVANGTDKSGQAGHEPAENVAATEQLVTA